MKEVVTQVYKLWSDGDETIVEVGKENVVSISVHESEYLIKPYADILYEDKTRERLFGIDKMHYIIID